jgi:hypothetical protein
MLRDDILDNLSAIRADTDTAKGHVLYGLQENPTLSHRITADAESSAPLI